MSARSFCRPAALVLALGLAGLAPSAQALDFVFKVDSAASLSAEQLSAFQTAANFWKSKFSDNVTVYLNVGFYDLGANTLGTTTWDKVQLTYGDVNTLLKNDRTSLADASAYNHLQTGPTLSFVATQPDLSKSLDNDGSTNNRFLWLTSANAKALGVDRSAFDQAGVADATIKFSTGFASNFAYSRVNGQVPGDKIDFVTVAEHEIGHALGFASGVGAIDFCIDNAAQCGTQGGFNDDTWYYPLDLYRYSAPGTLDVSVGPANGNFPYFSVDGGANGIETFATGKFHGNGQQAEHFSGATTTLMQAIVPWGASYDATNADILALDAVGWNVTAVPEPETYALLITGLAVIGWARRRSR